MLGTALLAGGTDVRADDPSRAESPAPSGDPVAAGDDVPPYGFARLAHDARFVARRPFTLERPGRTKLFAVLGATVVLYAARDEIRDAVQRNRSERLDDWAEAGHTQGTGLVAPALALGAWVASFAGERVDRIERRETAQMILESAGFAAIGAYGGSFVLGAERPEEGDDVHLFDVEGHGVSLDVALAASIVPPLGCRWLRVDAGDGPWRRTWKRSVTGLLYTGVALTAYQRMYTDRHWAPDVFLGAFTGLGAGNAVCAAHEDPERPAPRTERGVEVTWAGTGVSIRF